MHSLKVIAIRMALLLSISPTSQDKDLKETYLVATDGLHPSEKAYSLFVDRIAPKAKVIVQK